MKFAALPVLVLLALGTAACGAGATATAAATSAPTDTLGAPSNTAAVASAPTDTPSGPLGSISGKILAPPVGQPGTAMKIIAREKNLGTVYAVDVAKDAASYRIGNLPLGRYYVFGWYYPDGLPGAFTSSKINVAETSSDQLTCTNSLVEIKLTVGHPDFDGADIACWAGNYFSFMTPEP
jgi:hypothetical protein